MRYLISCLAILAFALVCGAQGPPERQVVLARAQSVYFDSHTHFVKNEELEKALLKHPDFDKLQLEATRDLRRADLIVEVQRAAFQNNFPYSIIDRKTKLVVAAGEVNSLGGTVYGKVASQLVNKIKEARAAVAKP